MLLLPPHPLPPSRPLGRPRLERPALVSPLGVNCSPCGCPAIREAFACIPQAQQQQGQKKQQKGTSSHMFGSGCGWEAEGMCMCSYGPHHLTSSSNGLDSFNWEMGLLLSIVERFERGGKKLGKCC